MEEEEGNSKEGRVKVKARCASDEWRDRNGPMRQTTLTRSGCYAHCMLYVYFLFSLRLVLYECLHSQSSGIGLKHELDSRDS